MQRLYAFTDMDGGSKTRCIPITGTPDAVTIDMSGGFTRDEEREMRLTMIRQ